MACRKIFEHRCSSCGVTDEYFVYYEDRTVPCSQCGADANRIISAPKLDFAGMGLDPAFPTAWDRVGKDMESRHLKADAQARKERN